MKTGSKRGAALAYVIVTSAVLMILATALVFSAKVNLDSATNSREGRQAYLDAKSAIEYGRAYVLQNPDVGNFTIVKTSGNPGFKIGAAGAADAVAEYSSEDKLITASAKYRSSDRVRKLGYQFTTEETGEGEESGVNEFLLAGTNYGSNVAYYNWWAPSMYPQKVSDYPVFISNRLQVLSGEHFLKAPSMMLFGLNADHSIMCDNASRAELTSDAIYFNKDILGAHPNKGDVNGAPRLVIKNITPDRGVIVFGKDCRIYGPNDIVIKEGCYSFQSGVDLFKLTDDESSSNYKYKLLTPLDETPGYAAISESILESPEEVLSGDAQNTAESGHGADWSNYGKIVGTLSPPDKGKGNTPRYVIYKKKISDSTKINNGQPIIVNYNSGINNYENKIIYWYLNDVSIWGNALLGNDDQNSNEYYTNVSNVYLGKEINLLYVNASTDFKIPEYKTVVFKADSVTLNTKHSDTEVGTGSTQPKITHSGSAARLIIEAQDPSDSVRLHVPNTLQVEYNDQNGIVRKYQIKAGWYDVTQINLFSDDAKEFFESTEPEESSGSSGSGGSSGGGTEITGGVYTDGE
ncbi:hypothetical protein [Caproiciproducens faecalis]|uniref:Type 4 fimbrial biogenesis protein PilX N-terminal domain-containing protein n=1 Tax=Caproiciproducens faecalis TaxID=2820301 RepID=A0ABS7DJT3_9FIRM|nr:hypothetical protein [Caproiciproducens faecalis]MBW7571555.1 hypothetical protein [Caproiciproducens faecalis]